MANHDWLKLLAEANAHKAETVPPGYKTRQEWAKHFGVSLATFDRQVPVLDEAGKLVRSYFKVFHNGRLVKLPHFRLCQKPHKPKLSGKGDKC